MYIYRTLNESITQSPQTFEVGFYCKNEKDRTEWELESTWEHSTDAAYRVHYLNGGSLASWRGVVNVTILEKYEEPK